MNDSGVWGDETPDRHDGTPVVRSTDIGLDGSWHLDDVAHRELSPTDRARKQLQPGDLVVVTSSGSADHLGKTAIVDETVAGTRACFSNFVQRLRVSATADPRYVRYLLMSSRGAMDLALLGTTTTGLRNLSGATLGLVTCPGPPVSDQRRIADFLDAETARIDALIAKKRRLADHLVERERAVVDRLTVPSVLGGVADVDDEPWPVTSLKRLATFFSDGDWIESPFITDRGIRLIQTGNVTPGAYREQGFRYVSDETFRELRCTEVYPEDVLISRLAGPVGCACLAPDLGLRMIASVDVAIWRPSRVVRAPFAVAFMTSSSHLDRAELLARGTTMMRLSRSQVGDMPVPFPPTDVQIRVLDELETATQASRQARDRLGRQIELLQEHRQGLITAAVTGDLDVSGVAA